LPAEVACPESSREIISSVLWSYLSANYTC
jgi:hypothetical protein